MTSGDSANEPTPTASIHPLIKGYRCWCMSVDGASVVRAVMKGADSFEAVRRATGACTRCQSCRPELVACLNQLGISTR